MYRFSRAAVPFSPRTFIRKRLAAGVAALCLCLLVPACGGGTKAGGGAGASGGDQSAGVTKARQATDASMQPPTRISQTVPLPQAPPTGKTVVFLDNGYPDTKKIGRGIEQAAKAVSWNYVDLPFDGASPSALQAALLNALTKSPSVVLEAGYPQTVFGQSVIDAYKKAGVPLIPNSTYPVTANGTIVGTSDGVSNGYRNNYKMGQALANWFVADSNGKGNAVLESLPTFPTLQGIADGFKQVTSTQCPGCKVTIATIGLSDVASGVLQSKVISAVRRDPNTGYVFFDNGEFGVGIQGKLSTTGLSKVKVGGVSIQPQQIEDLRRGSDGAWVGLSEYTVGYGAMDQAIRQVMGLPLTDNNGTQPLQVLDKTNVPSADEWDLPADALAQYKTLWKIQSP